MLTKDFSIFNKVVWRGKISDDISDFFYPSICEKIRRKVSFLESNLRSEFLDANVENINDVFLSLYSKEVVSRENFFLDEKKVVEDLIKKVSSQNRYKILAIYSKDELVFSALFSVVNEGIFFRYRAVKKDCDKDLKRDAILSYWGEKLIFEYGKKNNLEFISHGMDSHPFVGKSRIGLPLFKIKAGVRPKVPTPAEKYEKKQFNENFFTKLNEPVLLFDEENEEGFFTKCHLYCPKNSLHESYLNEFEKVMQWADIAFKAVKY